MRLQRLSWRRSANSQWSVFDPQLTLRFRNVLPVVATPECSNLVHMPSELYVAQVIPDTVLMAKAEQLELKAATVSSGVLAGMLGNPGIAREYQVGSATLPCCMARPAVAFC